MYLEVLDRRNDLNHIILQNFPESFSESSFQEKFLFLRDNRHKVAGNLFPSYSFNQLAKLFKEIGVDPLPKWFSYEECWHSFHFPEVELAMDTEDWSLKLRLYRYDYINQRKKGFRLMLSGKCAALKRATEPSVSSVQICSIISEYACMRI